MFELMSSLNPGLESQGRVGGTRNLLLLLQLVLICHLDVLNGKSKRKVRS